VWGAGRDKEDVERNGHWLFCFSGLDWGTYGFVRGFMF